MAEPLRTVRPRNRPSSRKRPTACGECHGSGRGAQRGRGRGNYRDLVSRGRKLHRGRLLYTDSATIVHTFVLNQVNGTWGFPDRSARLYESVSVEDASEMSTAFVHVGLPTASASVPSLTTSRRAPSRSSSPRRMAYGLRRWKPQGSAVVQSSGIAIVGGLDFARRPTTCVAGGDVSGPECDEHDLWCRFLINENNGLLGPRGGDTGRRGAESRQRSRVDPRCRVAPPETAPPAETTWIRRVQSQAFIINEVGGRGGPARPNFSRTQLLGSGLSNSLGGIACPFRGQLQRHWWVR